MYNYKVKRKKRKEKEESRNRDETERPTIHNYLNKNRQPFSLTGRIQLTELVHKITLSF